MHPDPTRWAWEVPLAAPGRPATETRLVLLAMAALSAPTIPGSTAVRLGVVDPTHPAIAELTGLTSQQVARHTAALVRAGVLVPAPDGSTLVRFAENVTASTSGVVDVVADTLAAIPEAAEVTVRAATCAVAAAGEGSAEQIALIDAPAPLAPVTAKRTRKRATADDPHEAAAVAVLNWWWETWPAMSGTQVSNPAAFSAHCKRVTKSMVAEGFTVEQVKDAFTRLDQPRPSERAVRDVLRGRGTWGGRASTASSGALRPGAVRRDPFRQGVAS